MPIIEEYMPVILLFLLIFVNISPVNSLDLPISRISDDSILRNKLKDTWFFETPRSVLSMYPGIETLPTGERVRISTVEGREVFVVMLSREQMTGQTSGRQTAERTGTGQFPGWAQGSWMLTRNKSTGAGTLIRIFLLSDQFRYIQFRPLDNEKCLMDVILYDAYTTRSLPVAVPFERLYTMQLNDVLKLVEGKFPIRYFEPDPSLYRDSRVFVRNVREHLRGLRFTDDGAIDENGNYVFINNLQRQNPAAAGLNCSGFTKWLIDGIIRPVTGTRLAVAPLKNPHGIRGSPFTVNWEERRDVFFGLDWIRNLAAEANSVLRSPAHGKLEEFEVRRDNFTFLMVSENRRFVDRFYPGFMTEAGYGIEGLRPLLYTLAIDEPYSFYLAAVNTEIATPSSPTGTPRLRQYFHVAALVPYFDENGVFRIVVFESAEETSFIAFRDRYPGHFVNLVQVPVTTSFDP